MKRNTFFRHRARILHAGVLFFLNTDANRVINRIRVSFFFLGGVASVFLKTYYNCIHSNCFLFRKSIRPRTFCEAACYMEKVPQAVQTWEYVKRGLQGQQQLSNSLHWVYWLILFGNQFLTPWRKNPMFHGTWRRMAADMSVRHLARFILYNHVMLFIGAPKIAFPTKKQRKENIVKSSILLLFESMLTIPLHLWHAYPQAALCEQLFFPWHDIIQMKGRNYNAQERKVKPNKKEDQTTNKRKTANKKQTSRMTLLAP